MARPREIKKRMGAVRTIQRITKTMQMIATAKFTSSLQAAQASQPFTERVQRLVGDALAEVAGGHDYEHALMDGPPESPRRERLLVITSNRGLCGAYNANVLRLAIGHVRGLRAEGIDLDLETAGKKAVGFFRFQGIPIENAHKLTDQPKYDEIEPIARRDIDEFMEGRLDAVRIASMRYVSNARQVPEITQLLPLAASPQNESAGARATCDFAPSPEAILDELLPLAVKTVLFQAFLDATVSEQIMRMVAMKAAADNARDLGRTLNRRYNRARQTQITTELMEVIGGAAALE